jgi:hypothetical protein
MRCDLRVFDLEMTAKVAVQFKIFLHFLFENSVLVAMSGEC